MSKVGTIWLEGEDQYPAIRGKLITLPEVIDFKLVPNTDPNDTSTHDAMRRSPFHSELMHFARVWENEIKKDCPSKGKMMFNIEVDHPDMAPMKLSAFPAGESGTWVIQTERKRGANAETGSGAPASGEAAAA